MNMITQEDMRTIMDAAIGNVVSLQGIMDEMLHADMISDFLVYPEDDLIYVYYSVDEDPEKFFYCVVGKE